MAGNTAFAKRLKELRALKGLTQKQLADSIGVSKSSIISYENELRVPSLDALVALERFFGVSGAYLQGETDNPRETDDSKIIKNVGASYSQMMQSIQQMVANNPHCEKLVWDILLEINRALRGSAPTTDASMDLMHTSIVQAASFIDCCSTQPTPEDVYIKEARVTCMVTLSDAYLHAQNNIIGQL